MCIVTGYAGPNISAISHSDCIPEQLDDLNENTTESTASAVLQECPRYGGGLLTIIGDNLGIEGAVVLIGTGICSALTHNTPSTLVTCELPPGTGLGLGVTFIQNGGALSVGQALISFQQCQPGFYQVGNEQNCSACDEGSVTVTEGQLICEVCAGGTYSNEAQDACEPCLAVSIPLL